MERGTDAAVLGMPGDDFFAQLELEAQSLDLAAVASEALSGILTVETEDGKHRSYEQIKQETEAFFANPLVAQNMELLSSLSMQYADFCAGHGFDATSGINEGSLGSVYDWGSNQHSTDDGHGHSSSGGGHGHAQANGKGKHSSKEKKKAAAPTNWYALLSKYFAAKAVRTPK